MSSSEVLYDVYLTGELHEGVDRAIGAERLAKLFKISLSTAQALVSGKPQLLKKGADHTTAVKYREAVQRAGLAVVFRSRTTMPSASPPPSEAALTLAAADRPLLNDHERPAAVVAEIDTFSLRLMPAFSEPATTATSPPPPAPDTRHLSITPAAGDLLAPEERAPAPVPFVASAELSLAAPGALLETVPDGRSPLAPATDHLGLAPAGGELLAATERRPQPPAYQLSEASKWEVQ